MKTEKELKIKKGFKITDEIVQKVLWEYHHGYTANRSKNRHFENQRDLFWTNNDKEKLKSNIFRSCLRTIQATCVVNRPDVRWEDEDCLRKQEARNFSNMYKYDYIKNNWDFLMYIWVEDISKYGKSVFLFNGWDDKKKIPTIERIDPRYVYPYNEGGLLVEDYPFFWFDRVLRMEELEKIEFANNEKKDRVLHNYDDYIASIKTNDAFYRDICTFYDKDSWNCTLHYHYTYIDEELYLFLMLWDCILDVYDVPETNNKIPIAVAWFNYLADDRWGQSLMDIVEDSHRTEQLLLNLFKIKVVREATGGNVFIDEEIFMKNANSFKNQSIKNRRFPVKMRDLTQPIQNMVYELPQNQVSWDIYNLLDMTKNKAMSESFVTAQGQGLGLSDNSNPWTATESKIQKMNANMITSLQNSILAYGTEEFAELYRDFIVYYWKSGEKKIRVITKGLSGTYKKLTKKDISWNFNAVLFDPVQWDIEAQEKKQALLEQYNMLVNDPQTPPFLLNNIRKLIGYYNGLDENELDEINIFDAEEYQCRMDIELLNNNVDIYIPPQCDVQKRLWYYNKAEETPAKFRALQALKYMIQQGLGQQEMNTAMQPKVDQSIKNMNNEEQLLNVNGIGNI